MKHNIKNALLVITLGLGLTPVHAEDSISDLLFATTGQNLWGERTASQSGVSYEFVNTTWVAGQNIGYFISARSIANDLGIGGLIDTFGLNGLVDQAAVGAGLYAGSQGDIEAALEYALESGFVDVNMPVKTTLTFPDPNSFAANQDIVITSAVDYSSGAYLNTTPPNLDLFLGGKFGVKAGVAGTICVGVCNDIGPIIRIPNKIVDWAPLDLTIVSIEGEQALIGIPGSSYVDLPYTIDQFVTIKTGISGSIFVPTVETTSSQAAGGALTAEGSSKFIDLNVDLDTWLKKATKIPLGVTVQEYGATIIIEALDIDFKIDFSEDRDAEFTPTTMVSLDFGGTPESVQFKTGDSVQLSFPDRTTPLEVRQKLSLENLFTHSTGHQYASKLLITSGKFEVNVPGYKVFDEQCIDLYIGEICIPGLTIPGIDFGKAGPLYTETIEVPTGDVSFFDKSWKLAGFSELQGNTFVLDPEDPSTNLTVETSNIINNGGGTRTVTFSILVENDGDVPLKNIQVLDNLNKAISYGSVSTYSVDSVQSCKLAVNPGFDGHSSLELLQGDDILDDGTDPNPPAVVDITEGLIVIQTVMTPVPFAADFINEVSSKGLSWSVGTLVEGSGWSTVNLGPGVMQTADDFVLYADHKVVLKDADFIRGHVGSNGGIEIQRGDSGMVAGDLRAIDVIDVHGRLIADYVFTNERVKKVGKGTLELSGGIKEKQSQETYELPVLAFAAGGEDIRVEADPGMPFTLAPGIYGGLIVAKNAVLILESGEYFFDSLRIASDAQVRLDVNEDEQISINIVRGFDIGKGSRLEIAAESKATTREVSINIMDGGNINIGSSASLDGIIVAPSAKITFQENSKLAGAVYAWFISLEENVRIEYHDDWHGELYKRIDLDCFAE